MWQACQLLLDINVSRILQPILGTSDITTRASLMKFVFRILSLCYSLEQNLQREEIFLKLGEEYTSYCWVSGIVSYLRDKHVHIDSEIFLNALNNLYIMSTSSYWMRHWAESDVLQVLLHCKRRLDGHPELIKLRHNIDSTISNISFIRPSYITSAISLRIFSTNADTKYVSNFLTETPSTVYTLLAEANDMSFGSTLKEQELFTKHLLKWSRTTFPQNSIMPTIFNQDSFWPAALQLAEVISGWICTLSLPLEMEERDIAKREKIRNTGRIIVKQVEVIRAIVIHALQSNYGSKALNSILTVLWNKQVNHSSSRDSKDHSRKDAYDDFEYSDNTDGINKTETDAIFLGKEKGLLVCLRHLGVTNIISEHFDSSKVQLQIISFIIQLLENVDSSQLEILCDMGLVYSCMTFFKDTMKLMQTVISRTVYHVPYTKFHTAACYLICKLWSALFSRNLEVINDQIIDSNIPRLMIEEYILDMSQLLLHGANSNIELDTLLVRYEVIQFLRIIIRMKKSTEKLLYHIGEVVVNSNLISKEMIKVKSLGSKKGSKLSKFSALCILALLAEMNSEMIDSSLEVND